MPHLFMNKSYSLYTKIIIAVSCIGLLIAVYSLAHHYSFTSGEFCTLGQKLNCDIVNRGPYSELFGIPVALLGIIGYLFFIASTVMVARQPEDQLLRLFQIAILAAGFLFSLYLTGVETFILHVWCLLCLTSQTVTLIALVCALLAYKQNRLCPPKKTIS